MSFINDYSLDVKNPIPGIYDQGTISDLDATSLYPSMINCLII